MEVGLADPLLIAERPFAAKEDFRRVVVHRQKGLADVAEDVLGTARQRLAEPRNDHFAAARRKAGNGNRRADDRHSDPCAGDSRRHQGGQLVVALDPRDREHRRDQGDQPRRTIEEQQCAIAVVRPDQTEHATVRFSVTEELFEVREYVENHKQPEKAEITDQKRGEKLPQHVAIDDPHGQLVIQ